jgi:hypothetical protein
MSKTKRILLLIFNFFFAIISFYQVHTLIFSFIQFVSLGYPTVDSIIQYLMMLILYLYCAISSIIYIIALFKSIKARELMRKWGEKMHQKFLARKEKAKINKKLRLEAKLNKMKEDE